MFFNVERDEKVVTFREYVLISTHALTWSTTQASAAAWHSARFQLTRSRGARQFAEAKNFRKLNFNSRAHVERDRFALFQDLLRCSFQLTRSRGARLHNRNAPTAEAVFQLTRSRGARQEMFNSICKSFPISTHALTWSATLRILSIFRSCSAFQLTRSRGARP